MFGNGGIIGIGTGLNVPTVNSGVFDMGDNYTYRASGDPYFDNVRLLIHGNSWGDYSKYKTTNLFTVYALSPVISMTERSIVGTSYWSFGATSYLSLANNTTGVFSGDFTIETWVKFNSTGVVRGIASTGTVGGTSNWQLSVQATNLVHFFYNGTTAGTNSISSTTAIVPNTWYHIAVTRQSEIVRMYINGIFESTVTSGIINYSDTSQVYIGAVRGGGSSINGHLDEFRITRGVARYTGTGSFTPPKTPFPNY